MVPGERGAGAAAAASWHEHQCHPPPQQNTCRSVPGALAAQRMLVMVRGSLVVMFSFAGHFLVTMSMPDM